MPPFPRRREPVTLAHATRTKAPGPRLRGDDGKSGDAGQPAPLRHLRPALPARYARPSKRPWPPHSTREPSMRPSLLAAALFTATLSLAACQPQSPAPADTTALQSGSKSDAQADARFADLSKRWLDGWLAAEPGRRHADRRPPLRRRARRPQRRRPPEGARLQQEDAGRARRASTPATLSRENQVDAAILRNQLRGDIWNTETLQSWAWDPQVYSGLAGGAIYNLMAREFAPMPERLKSADRAHGEDPGAVRADAREPRPGARAEDPRRDRRQAERRRAQPDRRAASLPHADQLQGADRDAPRCRRRQRCARPSPSTRRGSTRRWCRTPRAISASARRCTTRSCSSR